MKIRYINSARSYVDMLASPYFKTLNITDGWYPVRHSWSVLVLANYCFFNQLGRLSQKIKTINSRYECQSNTLNYPQ
jgi:hypothetical protein